MITSHEENRIIQLLPCNIETYAVYFDRTTETEPGIKPAYLGVPPTPRPIIGGPVIAPPFIAPMRVWMDRVHLWALSDTGTQRIVVPLILYEGNDSPEGIMCDPTQDDNCLTIVSVDHPHFKDTSYWIDRALAREQSRESRAHTTRR